MTRLCCGAVLLMNEHVLYYRPISEGAGVAREQVLRLWGSLAGI